MAAEALPSGKHSPRPRCKHRPRPRSRAWPSCRRPFPSRRWRSRHGAGCAKPEEVGDEELLSTLKAHQWKLQPAVQALGLSRINLYRRLADCSAVRTAAELGRQEIEDAMARFGGDLEAAAAALEVSLQGLKRRMTAVGLVRR